MRYAYGVTSALLLGGATISLITGQPAGAQVAQNDDARITAVTPRAGAPASFADLTEQLAPAVVNISTRQRVEVQSSNPFAGTPFEGMFGDRGGDQPTTREGQSLGSGFLISADGYVVTNNHVVTPQGNGTVEEITVTMPDGSEYEAKMVGKDAESDLAVLAKLVDDEELARCDNRAVGIVGILGVAGEAILPQIVAFVAQIPTADVDRRVGRVQQFDPIA